MKSPRLLKQSRQQTSNSRPRVPMLSKGMQILHNGKPVELLYLVSYDPGRGEVWKVRPLFVAEADRNELFRCDDRVTFVHTTRVR